MIVKQPVRLLRFLDPLLETPSKSGKTINKEDEQPPPDHGSGEDSLKSFYISRVSITVVLSYNTLMIQEISDLDDHIGILK